MMISPRDVLMVWDLAVKLALSIFLDAYIRPLTCSAYRVSPIFDLRYAPGRIVPQIIVAN